MVIVSKRLAKRSGVDCRRMTTAITIRTTGRAIIGYDLICDCIGAIHPASVEVRTGMNAGGVFDGGIFLICQTIAVRVIEINHLIPEFFQIRICRHLALGVAFPAVEIPTGADSQIGFGAACIVAGIVCFYAKQGRSIHPSHVVYIGERQHLRDKAVVVIQILAKRLWLVGCERCRNTGHISAMIGI